MRQITKIKGLFPFLMVLLMIPSVAQWSSITIANVVFWWAVEGIFLILCYYHRRRPVDTIIKLYLIWMIIGAFHGVLIAENYWDWKLLVSNIMVYFLAILSSTCQSPVIVKTLLKPWLGWAILLVIALLPFSADTSHYYGRLFCIYSTFALFYSAFSKPKKIIVFTFLVLTFILASTDRSDMFRMAVAFLLGTAGFRFIWKRIEHIIKPMVVVICLSPVILFSLASSGVFNVLNIGEELGLEYKLEHSKGHKDLLQMIVHFYMSRLYPRPSIWTIGL